jgi:hypothetical protein
MLEQSVTTVLSRNAEADVARDVSQHEDRFFFVDHAGYVGTATADGVAVPSHRGNAKGECEARTRVVRELPKPIARFTPYAIQPGNHCCDHDPPKTSCGLAIQSYIERYNRELARQNPMSVRKYCEE